MSRFRSLSLAGTVAAVVLAGALTMVGCAPKAEVSTPDPGASAAGAALLERRCSVCHTLDRVTSAEKSEAEWNTTIDRMRGNGAVVSEQEQKELVTYLLSK